MRSLSYWGKNHPAYARIIIAVSHCVLIWIGYFVGTQLSQSGITLSPLWIYFLIAVFFVTGAIYPSETSSKNYTRRKLCDFIAACCSFLLMICLVNDLNKPLTIYQTAQAVVTDSSYKYSEAKRLLEQFKKGEKTKFTSKEKRIIKKEFKYQLGQYTKARVTGNKSEAEKILLIILTCIAAGGLLYLVFGLACTLSCNGSEAAALIVFILGTAAIIWGTVKVIRSIERKKTSSKPKQSQ